MASTDPRGEVPDVSVSDSQGILIGSGNQYNAWAQKPPLDPTAVRDLNPHTAVARMQQLSHDELVDFFAKALPDDVTEIFKIFLQLDEAKLVAVLGDINYRKATDLIGSFRSIPSLMGVPEAASEIAKKAASLKLTGTGPLQRIFTGYVRRYKNGRVFWISRYGAWATSGAIDDCFSESIAKWGFPVGDEETTQTSPYGTAGVRQMFQAGAVYSSEHGTFLIKKEASYTDEGGSGGWLGFPVGETKGKSRGQIGQDFEGGTIYSSSVHGTVGVAVRSEVISIFPPNLAWHVISNEFAVVSSHGTPGTAQRFEVVLGKVLCQTKLYSSLEHGPVIVTPEVWNYYHDLDAEKSWLGFPIGRRQLLPPAGSGVQEFEGGKIYWKSGGVTAAVRAAVEDLIQRSRRTRGLLGFPLTDEQPVGADGSDRIQFFEDAVVTCRGNRYQVWLRP